MSPAQNRRSESVPGPRKRHSCGFFFALLPLTLLLAGCPDPMKKYTLNPIDKVANGEREQVARASAPFADAMVRFLRGKQRDGGNEFVLRVDFAPGSFAPRMDTIEDVEALLVIMRDFPAVAVVIEGHTDDAGDEQKNQKLSEWRANWVKLFLLERGIDGARVSAQGFGGSDPLADNATPKGREENRRLVVRVLNFDGKPMPAFKQR